MRHIALLIDESYLRALVRHLDEIRRPGPEVPESHQFAADILGPDFHGIGAVERHFGPLTDAERQALQPLRLRDHRTGLFLTEEQTLRVAEACKGTHVLVATKPLSLAGLHAACKDAFSNDQNAPWFGGQDQRRIWSDAAIQDPWLLVRKDVVPGSTGKDIRRQQEHLVQSYPNERPLLPVAWCYAAILHLKEAGEKLCPNHVVRFPVQAAEGHWVRVFWSGGRLGVDYWYGDARGSVGSCSARTS